MKSLLVSIFLCFASISFYAQNYEIKGTVSDASGSPLPGVSVVVKNTAKGASTDFDGKFTLSNVKKGETLVFSFIGYTTKEVAVSNSNYLNVTLNEDTQSLEEVVVVGYGTQKKSVVTGAISSVKAKDIENIPNGRIEQALQGRVSGVTIAANSGQPGSASTVRVRGLTTFDTYGGNQPLWVVDGVIVDSGGIGFVNQSDIESVEVLKDAASLAIYGSRSASGVILITTKKGKSGKIGVNYTGFTGVSSPAKTLNLLNASQYGALINEQSVATGGNVIFPDLSALGLGTDWQKAIFSDNAMRSSHEVSFSGGNDVSTFFASFGIQDTEGIVAKDISNYNKKNLRLNSTHKLSKLFTIGQTLGYSHQKVLSVGNTNSEFGGPLSSAINLDPTTPLVETDPTIANGPLYANPNVMRDENGNPYGISLLVGQEMTNPLAYIKTRLGNYSWSDDFVGNAYLEFNPIEGLKFKTSVGGKIAYWGNEDFTPVFHLNATNTNLKNRISRGLNKGFGWNIENVVSYSKVINDHDFTLLVGQGAYVDGDSRGTYVTYSDIPTSNYQDATFTFGATSENITGSAYTAPLHKLTSLFSRLNYNYKEKYLLTGVIRRDGSSRFGSNYSFGYFPSFSAGWVLSKEGFWKDNNIVNTLKLRTGYGITGNDAIKNWGFLATIGPGRNYPIGNAGTITIGNSPNAPSNPDLKWEETTQTNIAFDARLFSNFNLVVDFYKKITTGILQDVALPGYVGSTGSPVGNVADMENRGIEIELGYNKKFGKLNFSANGNYSYLENEVTYLGLGKTFIPGSAGYQSMGTITRTAVGQSYNSFYGFQTAGIFQNMAEVNAYTNSTGGLIQPLARPGDFRWVDTDGNGSITDLDKQYLGSPIPKHTFGFTMNLDYEGFDFMASAQGVAGNKIFQGLRRLDVGLSNYQTEALDRWHGEGTSNTYPRLISTDPNFNFTRPSNFYLENGDYLRLKIVQLGYSLPSELISKIGAQKLRLYVTGENLLTLTKYTGYDPEIGGNVLGIDRGYYPQAKSFMFGVNLQF
jgi:TonB-linked SusC/RagA family outer membrane protein